MPTDNLSADRIVAVGASLPAAAAYEGCQVRLNDNTVWYSNGTAWYKQQKITVGTVAPASPVTGDIWVDTN